MHKNRNKWLCVLLSMIMACVLALTACGGSGGNSGAASGGASTGGSEGGASVDKPLKIVSTTDIPNHLTMTNLALPGFFVSYNVYDGLTTPKDGDWNNVVPALAKDFEVSDDGLDYTFHLEEGVKFHDGSDFTASDVIATFDYMKEQQSSLFASVDSYTADGDYTVNVKMNAPYVDFLARLGSLFWGIVSEDALAEYGVSNEAAIGCGPYYIADYRSGEVLVLKAFDDYWDKERMPKIKEIDFQVITDSNTGFLALQNGDADVLFFATDVQYETALTDDNIDEYVFVDPSNYCFYLNTEKGQFGDIKVREALQYIIDREQVNMAATNGNAKAASSIWAETSPVYVDDGIPLDVDKGLKILEDAGYQPSDISFDIAAVADDSFKAAAENIQAQLLAVGMNVTVTTGDFASINEKRATGNFEALFIDTGANTYAPLRAVSSLLVSGAPELYNGLATTDPELQAEIDAMQVKAQGAATAEAANELGRELTQKYQESYTILPMIQKNSYHLYNSKVQGLYFESSSGFGKFQEAYWVE